MSIYERITDKMAEKWLYLEENTHFRYKAAVRMLKCAKSIMDGKTYATDITLIIAVLMLFGAYMADNPRWFSIPGLDQGQHMILFFWCSSVFFGGNHYQSDIETYIVNFAKKLH